MKSKHVIHFADYWIDLSKIECISDVFINVEDYDIFTCINLQSQQLKIRLPFLELIDKEVFEELCENSSFGFNWIDLKSVAADKEKIQKMLNAYNGYIFSSLIHLWLTYDNEVREV